MDLKIYDLVAYTDWERNHWRAWFQGKGKAPLEISTRGEKTRDIAELLQHIFAVECRYVQRLTAQPLTPYSQIPKDSAEVLFDFGYSSRAALRKYMNSIHDWNQQFELNVLDLKIKASLRKFVVHVLMHEVRHWAQVALLLRLSGYTDLGDHDVINSEILL
jgi:uncharacterized damage-inducible protein DinB